jgi:hypothetical protein
MRKLIKGALLLFCVFLVASCFKSNNNFPDDNTVTDYGIRYGGESGDYGKSVCEADGDNLVIVGATASEGAGENDVYLIKTDAEGTMIWSKTYGGAQEDVGEDVIHCLDNGFAIIGTTRSEGNGEADIYFVKADQNGDKEWSVTFGDQYYDNGVAGIQTADEGYLVVGGLTDTEYAVQDIAVYKMSAAGVLEWEQRYGDQAIDETALDFVETSTGYLILGRRGVGVETNIYLVNIDFNGNLLWEKEYDVEGFELGYAITKTLTGDAFIICGQQLVNAEDAENSNMYLVFVDPSGEKVLERNYGIDAKWEYEEAYDLVQTMDLSVIMVGRSKSAMNIVKVSSTGENQWSKVYGDPNASNTQSAYGIVQIANGNLIITGGALNSDESDAVFLRLDYTGSEIK